MQENEKPFLLYKMCTHVPISKIISVIVEKICHSFMAMSRLFGVLSFKNAVMNDALMTLVTLFSGSSVTFEVNRQ